jgi:hypothetical protein
MNEPFDPVRSGARAPATARSTSSRCSASIPPGKAARRGEAPEGKAPGYAGACFERRAGRMSCRYDRRFIECAQRFPEVPRLTGAERATLDAGRIAELAH